MHPTLEKIVSCRLVPVIKIDQAEDALPLCEALKAGGLPVAEITFRTDAAEEAIRRVHQKHPDILLGAGTVINTEQAKRAIDAGASYIISPGVSRPVVEYCLKAGIPVTPGAVTPTEVQYIIEYGLPIAKFFPAEQAGGLNMIKALAAPFPHLKFIPTGGINAKNLLDYLSFPKIVACGGSWMVKDDLITAGKFDAIRELTREAVSLLSQLKPVIPA